ncbi:MAG: phenylalanine--tRNA ligase subunit beta [Acidobacteriota bacterium]
MKLSYQWIAEAVDLPEGVDEVARRLTAAGLAVENQEEVGEDVALDVDITTNRPDCMNHLGMAREAAVLFGRELRRPQAQSEAGGAPTAEVATVSIEDPEQCRRYVAWAVRGVTIGPSPQWIVDRLELLGLRSVNNVVDITNYVLWECGQPLHAFDLAKLRGADEQGPAEIVVREARDGETLTTLDGEARELKAGMLIIADASGPIGLAGVMGGADSEVTDSTVDVLLESAYFDPRPVRRTASALGMHTDASHRFERGADPELCAWAAQRAAALLVEVAGGEISESPVDAYPAPFEERAIELSQRRLEAFAGARFEREQVEAWFRGLGFGIERTSSNERNDPADSDEQGARWTVTVPSWRYLDMERVEDLYEEVIRLYGYDAIEATLPALSGHDGNTSAVYRRGMAARRHLAACGLAETVHFAFQDAAVDGRYPGVFQQGQPGAGPAVELVNPLSDLYRVMRRSLVPGLLGASLYNQRRGASAVKIFEIGHVFLALEENSSLTGVPVDERETLAVARGGVIGNDWQGEKELDFFDLKGVVESLFSTFAVTLQVRPAAVAREELVSGVAADLVVVEEAGEEQVVGYLGQILDAEDLPFPLFVAELETAALVPEGDRFSGLRVTPPSRFPGVGADLTLTHSLDVPFAEILAVVHGLKLEDLADVQLVSRYQGKGVPEGAVNTTLRFHYSSAEGSLTQDAVNARQSAVQQELSRRFAWSEGAG